VTESADACEMAQGRYNASLAEAVAILSDLVPDRECRLDEKGNCLTHKWWASSGRECPDARAERFITEHGES
jgi:hypothetical protein